VTRLADFMKFRQVPYSDLFSAAGIRRRALLAYGLNLPLLIFSPHL